MINHLIRFDTIQLIAFLLSAILVLHLILFGQWMDRFRMWREIIPKVDAFLARHESAITFVVVAIVVIVAILWRTYHPPFKA